jgi:hypothetical protein
VSDRVRGDGLLPPTAYARDDEAPDDHFYLPPRKVVHIDEHAIAALGCLYAEGAAGRRAPPRPDEQLAQPSS